MLQMQILLKFAKLFLKYIPSTFAQEGMINSEKEQSSGCATMIYRIASL